jgi:hypothetical protein
VVVNQKPARFQSVLLRCWEVRSERPDGPSVWRFRLVDVETRQERGFPDLEAVMAFLKGELEGPDTEDGRRNSSPRQPSQRDDPQEGNEC